VFTGTWYLEEELTYCLIVSLIFLPEQGDLEGLDVGCGDGAIAALIQGKRKSIHFKGVEVNIHKEGAAIDIEQFDGCQLPFADNSFDFCTLIDVCHHLAEPEKLLKECARVSRKFVLIKDHYCQNHWDRVRLGFMDWFGNSIRGIHLTSHYLSRRQWQNLFEHLGFKTISSIKRLGLYPQPFSLVFDGTLHFIEKLEI